jgi:hypothetical protein
MANEISFSFLIDGAFQSLAQMLATASQSVSEIIVQSVSQSEDRPFSAFAFSRE